MKSQIKVGKVTLTPLLAINEMQPMGKRVFLSLMGFLPVFGAWIFKSIFTSPWEPVVPGIEIAWIVALIGVPLFGFFVVARHRFTVCEEGILIRAWPRRFYYPWDRFSSLTVAEGKKQLKLKLKKRGTLVLSSRRYFDQMNQVVSEHLSQAS